MEYEQWHEQYLAEQNRMKRLVRLISHSTTSLRTCVFMWVVVT